MKKQLLPIFIAVATLAGFASSCKKETTNSSSTEQKQAAAPSVELTAQGYLKFADIASFKATIESLKNKSDVELLQWEKQIGIQSLRNKYAVDTLKQIEEKNPIENAPSFGSIINKDGIYAIGDSLHKVTSKKEFTYSIKDGAIYNNEVASMPSNKISVYTINTIEKEIKTSPRAAGEIPYFVYNNTWTGDRIDYTPEDNFGRRERCKVLAFCNSYAVYSNLGIKIQGEAYRSTGTWFWKKTDWFSDEIHHAKITGTITYWKSLDQHINVPYSIEGSNTSEIRKEFDSGVMTDLKVNSLEAMLLIKKVLAVQKEYSLKYTINNKN